MPRPRTETEPDTPKVLDKALRVLDAFDEHTPEWSETALRRELGLPSTTLNRILRSLERSGYVLRREDGRYRLGLAAIRLGNRASDSLDLAAVLDSQIRSVAKQTNELTLLAVPDVPAGIVRYIAAAKVDQPSARNRGGRHRDRADVRRDRTGDPGLPAAIGDRRGAAPAVSSGSPRSTLTDPSVVRQSLERARREGWAMSWEETYDGAWAVAAPLVGDDGQTAFASIGVAAPVSRHTDELRGADQNHGARGDDPELGARSATRTARAGVPLASALPNWRQRASPPTGASAAASVAGSGDPRSHDICARGRASTVRLKMSGRL